MKHAREDYAPIQDPRGLIPEDEPVFLIRGQDAVGPKTVMHWAEQAELHGAAPNIVAAAVQQAVQMRVWQEKNRIKIPDMP